MDNRLITSDKLKEDSFETTIRPQSIDEYIGRDSVSDGERNPGSHNVSVLSLSKISNPNMLDLMK